MLFQIKHLPVWILAFTFELMLMGSMGFGQEDVSVAEIKNQSERLKEALNGGKSEEVAAMFIAKGELIDENGTIYQGREEIKELLTAFVGKFPGAQTSIENESIRIVGPVAIQEGRRVTVAKDGTQAAVRFISVLAKSNEGWRIVSHREFAETPTPTAGELLSPLSWLIGDWINEGADARVNISYRWSEDTNYILGEISVMNGGKVVMKSSQRIGWDWIQAKPRSWTFDSDGGFSEAIWTNVGTAWVIRSTASMPDAQSASATVKITPGEGRYTMLGTNRIVGNVLEEDFEITVVRQPPVAGK